MQALADALRRLDPSVEVTCLGTPRGLENRVVPEAGYPRPGGGVLRSGSRTGLERFSKAIRPRMFTVEPMALPRCVTGPGMVTGRTGTLLVQGEEFLGEVDLALAA